MQVSSNVENTKYVVSRVFVGDKTPAMLIEQRVLDRKSHIPPLTENNTSVYNRIDGSIQSKEVL